MMIKKLIIGCVLLSNISVVYSTEKSLLTSTNDEKGKNKLVLGDIPIIGPGTFYGTLAGMKLQYQCPRSLKLNQSSFLIDDDGCITKVSDLLCISPDKETNSKLMQPEETNNVFIAQKIKQLYAKKLLMLEWKLSD